MDSLESSRIAIVGAGPAGVAAAVQLRRQGLDLDLFERERVGGLLWHAQRLENYLGFPQGIDGPSLAALLAQQLRHWQIEPRLESVHRIEAREGQWRLLSDMGSANYRHVLLATGTRPRPVELPWRGESDPHRIHRGPLALREMAPCRIAIIGGGDAAFDYALQLAERHQLSIHHRSHDLPALSLLRHRAAKSGIETRPGHRLVELEATQTELILRFADDAAELRVDQLLLAVGREPELATLASSLLDENGLPAPASGLTAIGDLINGRERQASISAGQGVRAAMRVAEQVRAERS